MKRRTKKEWLSLFEEQLTSHLSMTEFSRQHHITPSYFYKRKAALIPSRDSKPSTPIVKVKRDVTEPTKTTTICIQHHQTQISLPININTIWLANFIKALA